MAAWRGWGMKNSDWDFGLYLKFEKIYLLNFAICEFVFIVL